MRYELISSNADILSTFGMALRLWSYIGTQGERTLKTREKLALIEKWPKKTHMK